MPETKVYFFQDEDGSVPCKAWLQKLRHQDQKAYLKCIDSLERLKAVGFNLRRPVADYVKEGIYELRVRSNNIQYRILFFFHGKNMIILSHGLRKEDKIPETEIQRALLRKKRLENNPERYICHEDSHG